MVATIGPGKAPGLGTGAAAAAPSARIPEPEEHPERCWQVVLITGAASGIGAALARRFAVLVNRSLSTSSATTRMYEAAARRMPSKR